MKAYKKILLILWILPLLFINRKEDQVSTIDNKKLLSIKESFPDISSLINNRQEIEEILKDRIGFRKAFISLRGNGDHLLFHKLDHSIYEYGKGEDVFFTFTPEENRQEENILFAKYLISANEYLNDRKISFYIALNPGKHLIFDDKIPDSVKFRMIEYKSFMKEIEDSPVKFINNVKYLKDKKNEAIYNKKYDVGHWTDLGAIYGIGHILEEVHKDFEEVEVPQFEDFTKEIEKKKYLPVSNIIINEEIERYQRNSKYSPIKESLRNELFDEMHIDENYKHFQIYENPEKENGQTLLLFRGSFFTDKDFIYVPSFKKVIEIHNYRNIFWLDYYVQLFQPDLVIFETADYVLLDKYFPEKEYNRRFQKDFSFFDSTNIKAYDSPVELLIDEKEILTDFLIHARNNEEYYLESKGKVYDFHKEEDQAILSLKKDEIDDPILYIKQDDQIYYKKISD